MKKLVVPVFSSEAEEAAWWFRNRKTVEANLIEAMEAGKAGSGTAQRLTAEARQSRNVTIRMHASEIERARRQAERKGVGYQTYIKLVLREALNKAERQT